MLLSAASSSAINCVTFSWTEILILQVHNTYLARQLGTVYSCQSAILSNVPWIKEHSKIFLWIIWNLLALQNSCIFITVWRKRISHPHSVIHAKCHGKDTKKPECINNEVQTCLQEDKMATLHIYRNYHIH